MTSASPEISNRFIIERKQSGYCSCFLFSIFKFYWIIFFLPNNSIAKTWKDALRTIQPHCISNYLIGRFTNTCQTLLATSLFFFSSFLSFGLVFVFLVGLIMILKHILINRTVWVWAPHATTTLGWSFCNASSCFTVPLFSIYFKMKDLSATFHLPGTNILLRGLFLSVNQIARIC